LETEAKENLIQHSTRMIWFNAVLCDATLYWPKWCKWYYRL